MTRRILPGAAGGILTTAGDLLAIVKHILSIAIDIPVTTVRIQAAIGSSGKMDAALPGPLLHMILIQMRL